MRAIGRTMPLKALRRLRRGQVSAGGVSVQVEAMIVLMKMQPELMRGQTTAGGVPVQAAAVETVGTMVLLTGGLGGAWEVTNDGTDAGRGRRCRRRGRGTRPLGHPKGHRFQEEWKRAWRSWRVDIVRKWPLCRGG